MDKFGEKPILFQPAMVKATLADLKRQTRRLITGHKKSTPKGNFKELFYNENCGALVAGFNDPWEAFKCPYSGPGGRLWGRENYQVVSFDSGYERSTESGFDFEPAGCRVMYPADGAFRDIHDLTIQDDKDEIAQAARAFKKGGITPSIHMPRWACRLELNVTEIRAERLQDITHQDAIDEGLVPYKDFRGRTIGWCPYEGAGWFQDPVEAYRALWSEINGPDSWIANPWLWVISFERLKNDSSQPA